MKLNATERIFLMGLLPDKESYKLMKLMGKVRDELRFSEEETRKFDVDQKRMPDGQLQVMYNKEVGDAYYKEIEFIPEVLAHFAGKLKDLDNKKALSEELLTLYEKFVA